jgi:hypothetical protein
MAYEFKRDGRAAQSNAIHLFARMALSLACLGRVS